MSDKYDRLYAALVTPYKADFSVDEDALQKLVQYFIQPEFIDSGGAIVVNFSTGELFYLSREEKKRNVEITVKESGGKIPVFAGVGDFTTAASAQQARDARDAGADGIALTRPQGDPMVTSAWDPNQNPEIWIDYLKPVVDAADLPALCPPTANSIGGLPLEATLKVLREVPHIQGWSMAYSENDYLKVAKAFRSLDRHVFLLAASALHFQKYINESIFDGALSGIFNYALEPTIAHINALKRGKLEEARQIWDSGLGDLQQYIYESKGRQHLRFKEATWLRGLIPLPFWRPPAPKPNRKEILMLRDLLAKTGLNVIGEDEINRFMPQFLP